MAADAEALAVGESVVPLVAVLVVRVQPTVVSVALLAAIASPEAHEGRPHVPVEHALIVNGDQDFSHVSPPRCAGRV